MLASTQSYHFVMHAHVLAFLLHFHHCQLLYFSDVVDVGAAAGAEGLCELDDPHVAGLECLGNQLLLHCLLPAEDLVDAAHLRSQYPTDLLVYLSQGLLGTFHCALVLDVRSVREVIALSGLPRIL